MNTVWCNERTAKCLLNIRISFYDGNSREQRKLSRRRRDFELTATAYTHKDSNSIFCFFLLSHIVLGSVLYIFVSYHDIIVVSELLLFVCSRHFVSGKVCFVFVDRVCCQPISPVQQVQADKYCAVVVLQQ